MLRPANMLRWVFFAVLSGAVCLAQTHSTASGSATTASASRGAATAPAKTPVDTLTRTDDSSYPEQAYLSTSRYTNQYFDFSFDFPADAHLRPITLPASRNGNIQLLELAGPPPEDDEVTMVAIPTASGNKQDAKTYLRESLDQELYRGVEELRGLSKANFAQHQFFLYETRRGVDQHMVFATTIGDYILEVMVASHDEKSVKRLETAFEHVMFFPPADVRQQVQSDAKSYDGPSISSHRLALLEQNPPSKRIDPGKISGDFYENEMLGFSYRIPQGWSLQQDGIVQPAIERYRQREDFGRPRMGRVEHTLVDECSKTLFSAWAKRPDANGEITYDDFGEVTVSALAMSCFPMLKFPKDTNDVQAFKDFVAQFGLTHPIVDDISSGKAFLEDGIVFLYLHGTVAFQIPNDELSRRLSLAMAITERRGYLLTWFFAAPHDAELEGLTNERAIFDNTPVKVASAAQPGGGTASDTPSEPAVPSTAASPTASAASSQAASTPSSSDSSASAAQSSAQGASSSTAAANTSTADQQGSSTDSSSSTAPSLLRPGETMDSQQGKGAVIKPK